MKNTNKKGFTLVELVIVIAVIAILAAVLIPTFTSVINRANQSAALQKWKAIVDEAYVEYVAEEHEIPKFVNVTTTTVEFEKTGTAANKALPTVTYTVTDTGAGVKDYAKVTEADPLPSFVVLDAANKVYFIWNTDGTYAVVASNATLGETDSTMAYFYTRTDDATTDDELLEKKLRTLSYGGVTYYGAPVVVAP